MSPFLFWNWDQRWITSASSHQLGSGKKRQIISSSSHFCNGEFRSIAPISFLSDWGEEKLFASPLIFAVGRSETIHFSFPILSIWGSVCVGRRSKCISSWYSISWVSFWFPPKAFPCFSTTRLGCREVLGESNSQLFPQSARSQILNNRELQTCLAAVQVAQWKLNIFFSGVIVEQSIFNRQTCKICNLSSEQSQAIYVFFQVLKYYTAGSILHMCIFTQHNESPTFLPLPETCCYCMPGSRQLYK